MTTTPRHSSAAPDPPTTPTVMDQLRDAEQQHRLANLTVKNLEEEQRRGRGLFSDPNADTLPQRIAAARAERTTARKHLEACRRSLGQATLATVSPAAPDTVIAHEAAAKPRQAAPAAVPAVADLFDQWAALTTQLQSRPAGVAGAVAAERAHVEQLRARRDRLARQVRRISPLHRGDLVNHVRASDTSLRVASDRLADLTRDDHPQRVAREQWEQENAGLDAQHDQVTQQLLDRVREASAHAPWMAVLPPTVDDADLRTWLHASAAQLAYRERYGIADASPLGSEPWARTQHAAWQQTRTLLAEVGVQTHAVTAERTVATPETGAATEPHYVDEPRPSLALLVGMA